ncbi:MAG: hypothetical protein WBE34_15760, partial [Candidatus Nitrosopolaris sp.]
VNNRESISYAESQIMSLIRHIDPIIIRIEKRADVKHAKQELFQTFRKLYEWNSYLESFLNSACNIP